MCEIIYEIKARGWWKTSYISVGLHSGKKKIYAKNTYIWENFPATEKKLFFGKEVFVMQSRIKVGLYTDIDCQMS